jgi:hypothetical protein
MYVVQNHCRCLKVNQLNPPDIDRDLLEDCHPIEMILHTKIRWFSKDLL